MGWETGRYKKMLRHARNVSNKVIEVGVVTPQTHKHPKNKDIDMAYLYQIQEEGHGKIPKRPTLRPATKDYNYAKAAKMVVLGTVDGTYIEDLKNAGDELSRKVKKEIMQLKAPPITAFTISRRVNKGTTNPLVDTGQLLKSIGYKIK